MSLRPLRTSAIRRLFALGVLLFVGSSGCRSNGDDIRRYSRLEVQKSLDGGVDSGLVLGEFPLAKTNAILDGDTIRVQGLDASLRLLAIDTEETFKKDSEWEAYRAGWEEYKRSMRGDSTRPVKMATPLGEEAKEWARAFFKDSPVVRLERDHPGEVRGYFGRYLVYVFAKKDGEWVNYNVECVRAGMSPYFQKYGRSRRFHDEFVQAQAEARAAKRGIWSDDGEHYDDYDERLAWWDARGDAVWAFEQAAGDAPDHIVLTRFDALLKLKQHLDKDVVVLATVSDIIERDRGPTTVTLSRSQRSDLPLVFFDEDVFRESGIASLRGEFVAVSGKVSEYKNQLQIKVDHPNQIRALSSGGDGLADDMEGDDPAVDLVEDAPAATAADDAVEAG